MKSLTNYGNIKVIQVKISCSKMVKSFQDKWRSFQPNPSVGFLTTILPLIDLLTWWLNKYLCTGWPQALRTGKDNAPKQMNGSKNSYCPGNTFLKKNISQPQHCSGGNSGTTDTVRPHEQT